MIRLNTINKGDVLAVARIAAVQAVKSTSNFIPLAHGGVPVEGCLVRVEPVGFSNFKTHSTNPTSSSEEQSIEEASHISEPIGMYGGVRISVQVETTAKTGVEMEALTGVVGAALTVVDMCKGVDKGCVIDDVKVIGKKGGRSGGLGIWREGPVEELQEKKGLAGISRKIDGETEKEPVQLVAEDMESVEKEDAFEQTENERTRRGRAWKKWTPDHGP